MKSQQRRLLNLHHVALVIKTDLWQIGEGGNPRSRHGIWKLDSQTPSRLLERISTPGKNGGLGQATSTGYDRRYGEFFFDEEGSARKVPGISFIGQVSTAKLKNERVAGVDVGKMGHCITVVTARPLSQLLMAGHLYCADAKTITIQLLWVAEFDLYKFAHGSVGTKER